MYLKIISPKRSMGETLMRLIRLFGCIRLEPWCSRSSTLLDSVYCLVCGHIFKGLDCKINPENAMGSY
jgi:hypothetical protein